MEGVVGRDLLGGGIARGFFEAVPILEAVAEDDNGLGIFDGGCDLLGELDGDGFLPRGPVPSLVRRGSFQNSVENSS
jgi:hypothetical protein